MTVGTCVAPGLALIFDLDGVIVHSNPVHEEVWRQYLDRFGIKLNGAMAARMFGRRNDEIVRDFFGGNLQPEEVFEHGAAKEALYREVMRSGLNRHLVPGVRSFLERNRAVPIGLATNAEPANAKFVLEEAGLRDYFRVVVDGHMVERPKPDPLIYLLAANSLATPAQNCIVFEDSVSGIAAARAAGARVVGLTTTHRLLPDTDLSVDNFRSGDLEPWLRQQVPLR